MACAPQRAATPVGQDGAFEQGVELVFDGLRQVGSGLGLSLRDEGRSVMLHQAVRRGLFRAVALAVDWDAIRRPLGLPAKGLQARQPSWWPRTASCRAPSLDRPGCRLLVGAYLCRASFGDRSAIASGCQQAACRHLRLLAGGVNSRSVQEADFGCSSLASQGQL